MSAPTVTSQIPPIQSSQILVPNSVGSLTGIHKMISVEESLIFTCLLKNGLKCFCIYSSGPNPSPQEEKDV